MSDRDRKQIVAEVNILKDLDHEHIVRYHDRYVDRDAGILYILMEYCGGGDLSGVIKQAQKHNRPVPEDTIWSYFMQILLALQHCHHPPNHCSDLDGKERRPQILHRDLKPDNVFLDENNSVKLGDFGLSKALPQASFANTYVGTPYYMSPELMQEKAYDSKSDIWSLGCLIYELCALKPPFHEAKTHAELSIFIRNGRIPPLPRGYSPDAVKCHQSNAESELLITKVVEAEKMLSTVKTHKSAVIAKEREVSARETALADREAMLTALVVEKDAEILRLHKLVSTAQSQLDARIREAVGKREEELRVAVRKREEEVAAAMARREDEILSAVRQREQEIFDAWRTREEQIKAEAETMVTEKMQWMAVKEADLEAEQSRLDEVQKDLEAKLATLSAQEGKGRKEKTPLEEVKNLLAPLVQMTEHSHTREKRVTNNHSNMATPVNRNVARPTQDYIPSAMKGVILTHTGQPLTTPTPAELANLFVNSPKVGLDFAKIFDFESEAGENGSESEEEVMPPSPTVRERPLSEASSHSSGSTGESTSRSAPSAPPARLRKPSIRGSVQRPSVRKTSNLPASASDPTGLTSSSRVRTSKSSKDENGTGGSHRIVE
ncbi:kinase-like domain-containing protein [Butyriboletus roseoflavus]|nr:kinase-like domain-containing protein [Butyriboletus roseoflavus]